MKKRTWNLSFASKAYPAEGSRETAVSETAQTDKHRWRPTYIIPTESRRRLGKKTVL
jgi:hypothetical protein